MRGAINTPYRFSAKIERSIKLYVNGVLQSATANLSGTLVQSQGSTWIGAKNGNQFYFKGIIDEVAIYAYDNVTASGSHGKGKRTGMIDAVGTTFYKYDNRGRLIGETRILDPQVYTTSFAYDGADRLATIAYPTGENVTQGYNGRGLPYSLTGSTAGNLVTSTLYNNLGQMTELNLGSSVKTTFGYWDVGGTYDNAGVYYGRLWQLKTVNTENTTLQQVKHTWDAGGNLVQRENLVSPSENETFSYDFLDRLTSVSGAYSDSWSYSEIGNMVSHNGTSYTYPTNGVRPHAVSAVDARSYQYDNNGNMYTRGTASGNQTITWDAENRPVSITGAGANATFIYDGDGNRVKKIEGGDEVVYVNRYYEKNLTTSTNTSYYYLGGRLVAMSNNSTLSYIHQDHLSGTAVVSDTGGNLTGSIRYFPFGATRSGSVPTDKLFTGQRLDDTGLYYFRARYYDAGIGRFISPDTVVQDFKSPQTLNRYTYTVNNPLRYVDPTGNRMTDVDDVVTGSDYQEPDWSRGTTVDYWPVDPEPSLPLRGAISIADLLSWEGIDAVNLPIDYDYGPSEPPETGEPEPAEPSKLDAFLNKVSEFIDENQFAISFAMGIPAPKVNPLQGVKYTQKVLSQMKIGDYHAFPKIVDNFGAEGVVTKKVGELGLEIRIRIEGSYNGVAGAFEYGINEANELFHRFFRPF
ncbi:MAG: hypothetical protein HY665_00135 [Chloroflexi bacterium]|nr:hypothetical protein [Chloroflexota bacterium]